ncbi:MAG: hypothetical protein AAGA65_19760 [Actinomycetota bacterium]
MSDPDDGDEGEESTPEPDESDGQPSSDPPPPRRDPFITTPVAAEGSVAVDAELVNSMVAATTRSSQSVESLVEVITQLERAAGTTYRLEDHGLLRWISDGQVFRRFLVLVWGTILLVTGLLVATVLAWDQFDVADGGGWVEFFAGVVTSLLATFLVSLRVLLLDRSRRDRKRK